ncbi:hypothetical protein GRI44_13790 [Altererythrobacter confluentis]|uniref:Uncharacterized protein n=1 Tax=Allopontixanthobacter confluentis TaxID=1849021 RepID=A0A6L7GMG7_9SPHN|nr:hypothetical protein [Allopontixanthobacter confluentis]MXP15821.1 hypothetical protein [Allopontixanthobacter confluentis]
MIITVDQSPVGSGKTHNALTHAIRAGGRWLFAVERIESIAELAALTERLARSTIARPKIVPISSASTASTAKRGESVRVQIEALPEQYQAGDVIAFCTHEAILKCDFRAFAGWHFVCDEVPSILHIAKMQTKLDRPFFESYFELEHVHAGWSLIKPTAEGRLLNGSDLMQCDGHARLRKLHEIVVGFDAEQTGQAALCNMQNWSEMEGDRVVWVWWSQFSFAQLSPFSTVTVLASRFFDSFAYHIAESWNPEIKWIKAPALPVRPFAKRKVSIRYFLKARLAAKSFFETTEGHRHLIPIAEHISKACPKNKLIWSCNETSKKVLATHLPKGGFYSPKQAGTSLLMSNTHAAMIYAAKPSREVRLVLKATGASTMEWIRTNEHETILQFVSRTSVRDASSSEDVMIFVYDHAQAIAVQNYFESQPHNTVDVRHVDLNLPASLKPRGRPRAGRTKAEAALHETARKITRAKQQRDRRDRAKAIEAAP